MDKAPGATVGVAAILKEPLALTLRFVAWYLELGAARIDLYFDDPNDPAIVVLQSVDRVYCHRCDADFWAQLGLAPDTRFTLRQNQTMTKAYGLAQTDWLLVVDADELLYLGGRSLGRVADGFDPDVRGVIFPTAEAVRSDLVGIVARTPLDKRELKGIYDEETAWLLRKSGGLVGHVMGKSMTRTGLKMRMVRQHFAVGSEQEQLTDMTLGPDDKAALLHFPDTGYANWRRKLAWRSNSWGFSARLTEAFTRLIDTEGTRGTPGVAEEPMVQSDAEAAVFALYEKLHRLSPDQIAKLKAAGACLHLDIDPNQISRRWLGDARVP